MGNNKQDLISNKNKQNTLNHSASHLLAQAVLALFPKTKLGIGPAIEKGFYYDFQFSKPLSDKDFPKIEKEITKIIKQKLPFDKKAVSLKKAKEIFADQPFKLELINDLADQREEKVFIYHTGKKFIDLCQGPHLKNTSQIKAFKLIKLAGAYWKGSEKNPMLTRIYGVAFDDKKKLENYLNRLREAKKRDHRKLGKELGLFSQNKKVGPGLILWHPKLSTVREEIELYWRKEHRKRGYQYVYTPHIGKEILWQTSGHTSFYKDLMYPPLKDQRNDVYYVKPMSCPFHVAIYNARPRSYRELPLRLCELGTVYRYEPEGVRHGILRPRGFTQDDAHIICTEDQVVPELEKVLNFAIEINKIFGFDKLHYELSLRNPKDKKKYIGTSRAWKIAEKTLKNILDYRKVKYEVGIGEAKFYGPAIDLKVEDAMGRLWQGTTIQFDFNLPNKFNMKYTGEDNKEHEPYMIHRTVLGSMERFVGTLIEHYGGAFPVWLAPMQIRILPITEKQSVYGQTILRKLQNEEIRADIDDSSQTLSYRIRQGQLQKIPFLLILGEKEKKAKTITVRQRGGRNFKGRALSWFIKEIKKLISVKSLALINDD